MENRFTFKDFFLFALLAAILVSIWLGIKAFDRQWDDLRAMQSEVRSLVTTQNAVQNDVADLRRALADGVVIQGSGKSGSTDAPHALDDIRAARSRPNFAEGDVIVDAFGTRIKSVTALTYGDLYGRRIQNYVLESLVIQHEDTLEYLPHIAESWEIQDNTAAYDEYLRKKDAELEELYASDPSVLRPLLDELVSALKKAEKPTPAESSPEHQALLDEAKTQWKDREIRKDKERPPALVITFKLRRDVRFSDGQPLTAHDVEYTWQLLNNPLVNAPETRNFYDNVESYKALDDYTVEFRFREPHYLAFGMVGGFNILPKHFYSRFTVDDINRRPGLLLGSGPYRLEDPENWGPGNLMKLVRNENYWGPKPGPAALVWLEIEQDVPRMTAFKNGEIDVFSATPDQYLSLKDDPAVQKKYQSFEYQAIPSGYSFIAWNISRAGVPTVFADKRVRQAMTYLIPRQRIATEIFRGLATPTNGPFDEGSRQADPSLTARPQDHAKALALLAEVGWKPGPDGVLRNSAGEPFRFTLTYPSGNADYERTMLMVKDALSHAGILMTQDPQEWSVFIERVDGRAFDACALAWGGGAIEGDIRQMFHSSQIAGGANNFTSYSNPELDRLIDQARRTIDEDKRMELWQACHRILYEDQPYTFMMRRKSLVFIDGRIDNVKRVTTGLNDRTQWYVPAPQQLRKP